MKKCTSEPYDYKEMLKNPACHISPSFSMMHKSRELRKKERQTDRQRGKESDIKIEEGGRERKRYKDTGSGV